MKKCLALLFVIFLAGAFINCSGSDGTGGSAGVIGEQGEQGEQGLQGDSGETEYPRLYVSDRSDDSIKVFNNAMVAGWSRDDIFPDRKFTSIVTPLDGPYGMWLDEENDRLYVGTHSTDAILVFDNASVLDGTAEPNRTITDPALNNPYGFYLASNSLYVANFHGSSVTVHNSISTIDGDTPPDRTITFSGATPLEYPISVIVNETTDELYVSASSGASNSILIFSNASTVDGVSTPSRTMGDGGSTLNVPYGVALDTINDRLYVVSRGADSIVVYNSASTANSQGLVADRIIFSTGYFTAPADIWLDLTNDRLYVSDNGSDCIYLFDNASAADGDTAPTRTINGTYSGFITPYKLWLDLGPEAAGK